MVMQEVVTTPSLYKKISKNKQLVFYRKKRAMKISTFWIYRLSWIGLQRGRQVAEKYHSI